MFLKSLIFAYALEGGFMPVDLFVGDVQSILYSYDIFVRTGNTYYARMETRFEITKYFEIGGALTSYQYPLEYHATKFYPFRIDYGFHMKAQYKGVSIQWVHGCDHTLTPIVNSAVPYKFDFNIDKIGIRFEGKVELFK